MIIQTFEWHGCLVLICKVWSLHVGHWRASRENPGGQCAGTAGGFGAEAGARVQVCWQPGHVLAVQEIQSAPIADGLNLRWLCLLLVLAICLAVSKKWRVEACAFIKRFCWSYIHREMSLFVWFCDITLIQIGLLYTQYRQLKDLTSPNGLYCQICAVWSSRENWEESAWCVVSRKSDSFMYGKTESAFIDVGCHCSTALHFRRSEWESASHCCSPRTTVTYPFS